MDQLPQNLFFLSLAQALITGHDNHRKISPIGRYVSFTCNASGSPAPKIQWFASNGEPPLRNWTKVDNEEGVIRTQQVLQYHSSTIVVSRRG